MSEENKTNKESINWELLRCGGLWEKGAKLSGVIRIEGKEYRIFVFSNKFKNMSEGSPDFKIYATPDSEYGKKLLQSPVKPKTVKAEIKQQEKVEVGKESDGEEFI